MCSVQTAPLVLFPNDRTNDFSSASSNTIFSPLWAVDELNNTSWLLTHGDDNPFSLHLSAGDNDLEICRRQVSPIEEVEFSLQGQRRSSSCMQTNPMPTSADTVTPEKIEHDATSVSNPVPYDSAPQSPELFMTLCNTQLSFGGDYQSSAIVETLQQSDRPGEEMEKSVNRLAQRRGRKRSFDPEIVHTEKLEKNRKAAERCRQKQRAYITELQYRAREEEQRRSKLVKEVTKLKEMILMLKEKMVIHNDCQDDRIQQYLLHEVEKSMGQRSSISSRRSSEISK